jgi:DNA repair photolyase
MVQHIEIFSAKQVLSPRRHDLNEMFLASYHLRSYGGCEFGCPYCDGLVGSYTPLNSQIQVYLDHPKKLAQELAAIPPHAVLGLTHGEPYQPVEGQYRITRQLLQVVAESHHPIVLLTKSPTVCEDIPILAIIHQRAFAVVVMSVVTPDTRLACLLEAQAPPPNERLQAIATLKEAGIPCGIAILPIFPYVTDQEASLIRMFEAIQAVMPDFVVWDTLWVQNAQHMRHIQPILSSLDEGLIVRYTQLYHKGQQPSVQYRQQMNHQLLVLCRQYGMTPRIPEHVYADTLSPDIVAELRLRNQQLVLRHREGVDMDGI